MTSRKIKIGLQLFILSSSLIFIREGKEKEMSFLLVALVLTGTLVITIPTFKRVKIVRNDMSCLSIIIPARNEEKNLTFLLQSLQLQNADFEVIVVDDNSTDHTERVARAFGVKVVHPGTLPAGWLGKSWACWNGAREAKGSVLLFLDADLTVEKDGIEKVFFYYQQQGGVLSVHPYHLVKRPYEMFSALFHYVTFASIGAFHPFKNWKSPSVGFGQCLLCSAASYFQSGGHEGIKKEVVENMALVEKMSKQGEFITCMSGQGALSMRMYPDGMKSLIRGWSKSFASGAGKTEAIYLFLVSLWLTSMINYVLFLPTLWNQHAGLAISSYVCYVSLLFNSLRKIGSFTFFSLCLFPIHVLFFLGLFVWSFIQTAVRKQVKWKERSISIEEEKKKKVIK